MAYDVSKKLGNYRLLELLGQGGFADVYLGEHVYLKTSAAIKVLRLHLSQGAPSSFLAEARTIARLRHPHIVLVHDFGIENDVPFLVMGYAPYGSLRRLHPLGSVVPLQTVALYVKQMAQALQYAHEQKIIHRDVKPENMLLGEQQQLMLSDFGIAVTTQSMPSNPMLPRANSGEALGTTTYMAPELFTADAVFASDQYSLGIVIYEWLCGSPPFSGSDMEIALQHVHISAPSLLDKAAITAEVEHVVMKALAKKPEERYPSMLDFAHAFEQACAATFPQAGAAVISAESLPPPTPSVAQMKFAVPPSTPPLDVPVVPEAPRPTSGSLSALPFSSPSNKSEIVRPQFGLPSSAKSKALLPATSQEVSPAPASLSPASLKLPAHGAGTTRRLADYASDAAEPSENSLHGARPLRLSSFMSPDEQAGSDATVIDIQLAPAGQDQSRLAALKQLWQAQAAPAIKHLWVDQTVPTVRHLWVDQTVPAVRHLWSDKAVPAARKILSIPLVSPDPQQESLPPPYMRSNSQRLPLHSTQSVPAAHKLIQTQSVPAIPPSMQQSSPVVSRRVVIGSLAAVAAASVAGVVAMASWQSLFQTKEETAPTSVPQHHQAPAPAPTSTQTPSPTAVPQNAIVLGPTRPAVVSWGPNQLDLFVRGTDGGLWQRHYDGSWHDWAHVLDGLSFDPVVTAWSPGRFDAFARGADNTLQHTWYDGSWHPWESLGGSLTSDPCAVSWGPNRLDIFARSVDNALWHKAFDGSWHDWERLDGVMLSSPSAATWGPNRLDVFVRGADSALWHRGFDGTWHDWESLGGSFESDPAAVSIGANHLDVFVRGAGNVLQQRSFDGAWHDWQTLTGVLTTSPTTTTWGNGRIDVFSRTANNVLQQTWYSTGIWQPWLSLS
ncbi:protein kinase domain-containing protein [Dictyobacter kobayashii]|uniref:non-specific serine/threonine protein kinase n=1 Tax=Dictyobacter kobayashii TaxID=2014872 RepID=A0A402AU71_9CHLR|nr:protein kinase [Dictyobacter kobayashii]GCE22670.1 hypothetical protein KDK_64700 [Dictyobacter kobayashii]